jgi:hypothetical protein
MTPGARQATWLVSLFTVTFVATWLVQTRGAAPQPAMAGDRADRGPTVEVAAVAAPAAARAGASSHAAPGVSRPSTANAPDDAASREAAAREMRARALDRLEQLLLATQDRNERLDAVQNLSELALAGDPSGRIRSLLQQLRDDADPEVAAFAGYKADDLAASLAAR